MLGGRNKHPVGRIGRARATGERRHSSRSIVNVIRAAVVHHCTVSGFRAERVNDCCEFASQVRPSFEGRPTICRHVSCFVHYAALFPSPDWPPRFNWRRNPPPRQIEFGPFPGARQAGRTRRKGSSTCPTLAGRPLHVCTEVPPRSITIAISCAPGSPDSTGMHWLGQCR